MKATLFFNAAAFFLSHLVFVGEQRFEFLVCQRRARILDTSLRNPFPRRPLDCSLLKE